jgi:hypothetical protein
MTTTPADVPSVPEGPYRSSIGRDLVVVSGPDATSFLQSLVSQDVEAMAVGESGLSLLLAPQGKLLFDFRTTRRTADEWWLDLEAGAGEALAAALGRYRIRIEAEIEARPVAAVAVRGIDQLPAPATNDVLVAPVLRGSWRGADVLGPAAAVEATVAPLGLRAVDAAAFDAARIAAGVPRLGADVDERTIPQEAALERDAVSFTKGCFVGQELVCRIDARGHVNRVLRRIEASDSVAAGAVVERGGKEVGAVTSAAGRFALAMVRREVEPGAEVSVGGTPARVRPLRPGL